MTTQKILTYRGYEPGDESKILSLFSGVFHKEMTPAFWRWRYLDDPFGRGIIRMAFDGDRLVGHFAAVPFEVATGGKTYADVFPMTAMTDAEYHGQGIFTRLMDQAYEAAGKDGISLVYGFCNQNSLGPSLRYGYKNVIKTTLWEKALKTGTGSYEPVSNVREINRFDGRFDALWDKVKDNFDIINVRNRDFLNWRYVDAPHAEYAKFVYSDGEGGILGYAVLKIYTEPGLIKGHIIDLLTVPDEKAAQALIRKAYEYFSERDIPGLSLWMMGCPFYEKVLEKEGFTPRPDVTNFGVKILDANNPALAGADDTARWYITMGDSDVY